MLQTQTTRIKNNNQGFTLVETLIAMVIFAIAFLAITSMQISASKGNRSAGEVTQGVTVAADRMERLMVLSFDDNALDPALNPHQENQGKYAVQWDVTNTDLNADGVDDAKSINMTVTWNLMMRGGLSQRNVTIDFVKPNL
jgi:prepilin-type N-terminal cleavage/methylation domain-containing protein